MSAPFVAEIRPFACNFAPTGWALCAGQILPISQNTALFSLVGTYYGGDGKSTFGLPNLQGNVPIHSDMYSGGGQFPLGAEGGEPYVTLLTSEMPVHSHSFSASTNQADQADPAGATAAFGKWSTSTANGAVWAYSTQQPDASLGPFEISTAGGSQPHNNMMPYQTINFCIALQGIYPQRP